MKEHKKFNLPEKGFEDFETKINSLKKNQSSQTFFKIKKTNLNFNSTHYRAKTMTSEKANMIIFGKNKNEITDSKKLFNFDEILGDHDLKLKNIEGLAKVKRKCNEFSESGEIVMPSAIINYLMKGIKIISNLDFEYHDLISFYPFIFESALYLNSELIEGYKELIEKIDQERIKSYVKMNRLLKCPYTVFCAALLEEHKNKLIEMEKTKKHLLELNEGLHNKNKKNEEIILILNQVIDKMKEDEKTSLQSTKLQQMQIEINKFANENVELRANLEVQNMKVFSIENELNEYKMKCEYLQINNISYEEKIENLQIEKEKTLKEYEAKLNSFKGFKEQAFDLKNTLDKMLIKISAMKNYFLKIQKEKSDLLEERHDLVLRAAAGFENLTPRPNYSQLFSEKNLKFSNLVQKIDKKKKQTTFNIVDSLLSKICEYQAKIAFMDNELNERRKGGPINQSQQPSSSLRRTSVSQNQKMSFNARVTGGSISPVKNSKMISLENIEKKSRFININNDDDIKSSKDKESNFESPPKTTGVGVTFDFKNLLNKEDNMVNLENEKEEIKETENLIQDIIESKKMIEKFNDN